MTPVRAVKNQYRGINAHLHSFWQATNTWSRFHHAYIVYLQEVLREQLLPLGYAVEIEESLQIRRLDTGISRRSRSDVVVYDSTPSQTTVGIPALIANATIAEVLDDEDEEHPYLAITLHPLSTDLTMGDAVTWIEVLSPTNKGDSVDARAYLGKRRALLDTEMIFIEVDFLHETPPTFSKLADYTQHEAGSHPYRMIALDPRHDFRYGPAQRSEFDVDSPIPNVALLLSEMNNVELKFDEAYRRMFERGNFGYQLDYAALPHHFDRYSAADQTRIARRMVAVLRAAQAGVDLETAPLPVDESLSLDAALAQLEHLKGEA
jgi:hypothetical protein